ncbi:hypothetical protein [Psychromonas sp. Urea-02u-13]|uniref:hypothetical protein n=1 Tax=Psychromonas sp. Urea-02u-13 TaxID=2058326 RepID=UPI000C33012C|nr:hypothetical protein [Psychromonas sp. Urea-02u-13]PKG37971.1 hypothetical protein CXF74_16055 [Psychromonas sp. Urea-02u-13]
MYQLSILVVLYNTSIGESSTLNSLLNLMVSDFKIKLVIWNNGPKSIVKLLDSCETFTGFDMSITETLHNESLSKIYNSFVDSGDAHNYLILDHDSVLSQSYIDAALHSSTNQVSVPVIICSDIIRAPFVNKLAYNQEMTITNSDCIISIGSGLVINKSVINEMRLQYGKVFDERFYLYGVDTTFFKRLNNFTDKELFNINILPPIVHSLSRYETEESGISNFRIVERSYDFGLSLRYYTAVYMVVPVILKSLFTSLNDKINHKKSVYDFKIVIKAYFTGKHYRTKV